MAFDLIDDVFCKIIKKELPADIIMEGDDWMAIKDISPQAPVHVLIISKKHFDDLDSFSDSETDIAGRLLLAANKVADKLKLDRGFRLIINRGEHSGRLVPHFHIHLIGGKRLGPKVVS